MKPKDKKSVIFYFLMSIVLLDFGRQIRIISYSPYLINYKNPIFSIEHVYNTGGAFGMFHGFTEFLSVFAIIMALLLFVIVYKNVKFSDKSCLLSLTLLNAGTLGNLIERIKFHHVIDYINLSFINFPVFNAFDVMICLGITIYIVFVLIDIKQLKTLFNKNENNN